ncbi:MAG: hypothetical protein DME22_06120 [Verrucomicrobia bacterium]|nr:MAG: hypothetical protein DME22_06120 [Verrucomicrobiota bacterium]PYJ97021.1 MAG: hypothetical protein DME23_17650 [Verrucomicrobiota bacterium]
MIDAASFRNVRLRGGYVIAEIEFTREPLVDALGREAAAQTRIVGNEFRLMIRADLDEQELSITLYHEILEAASVASLHPPSAVAEFNEGDFERAAQTWHEKLGVVTPEKLNDMLQSFGFRGE